MVGERNGVHAETDAARAGSTPHVVRWVLGISLFAVIVLLSAVWITGALTQSDAEDEASVSSMAADDRDTADTDATVIEGTDEFPSTPETGAVDSNRIDN